MSVLKGPAKNHGQIWFMMKEARLTYYYHYCSEESWLHQLKMQQGLLILKKTIMLGRYFLELCSGNKESDK